MTSIAVIGGGAAGIGAARTLLHQGFEVTLIESAPRLGGNCLGLPVRDAHGTVHRIDVGVSDFNRVTFTEVARLIDDLGLETQPICQDAHFASITGESLWACRDGRWTFRRRIAEEEQVVQEIDAFRIRAPEVLEEERFADWSVARYLDHVGASPAFRAVYLHPRAMGCFPMPDRSPETYSIRELVRFWNLHGLVGRTPGQRHTVVGGMHRYVDAFQDWFQRVGGQLLAQTRVIGVQRHRHAVEIRVVDEHDRHRTIHAAHVVFTNHAHEAFALIENPTRHERETLPLVPYQRARLVVHRDEHLLGSDRELFGAFHYVVPEGALPRVRPTITFYPNRLGRLPDDVPDVYVTMNPHIEPRPDTVLATRFFVHPIGCRTTERTAARIETMQGRRRTWFAGSYLRSPFIHESALRSGIDAARRLIRREEGHVFEGIRGVHLPGRMI